MRVIYDERKENMQKIYLISSGSYSDYGICFLAETRKVVSEDEFRVYWLEAVKRKTEYVDNKLEAVAKCLGVAQQLNMYGYYQLVESDSVAKAMREVGYEHKGEVDFFEEILTEQGFSILSFEEYNVDDF